MVHTLNCLFNLPLQFNSHFNSLFPACIPYFLSHLSCWPQKFPLMVSEVVSRKAILESFREWLHSTLPPRYQEIREQYALFFLLKGL